MGVPGIWSRPFLGISSVLQKFLLSGNEQANRILISERSEPSTYLSNTKGVEYHGGNCNQHSLFFTNFGGTPNRVCFYHMFPISSVKVRKAFAFEQVLGVSGPSTTSDKATISINNLIIAPVSLGLQQADDIELAGSNSSSSVAQRGGATCDTEEIEQRNPFGEQVVLSESLAVVVGYPSCRASSYHWQHATESKWILIQVLFCSIFWRND